MVRVLTSLLAMFHLSQDYNDLFICSVNDRIYEDENDRPQTAAVDGN